MRRKLTVIITLLVIVSLIGCDNSVNIDMNSPNIKGPVKVVACKGSFTKFGDEQGDEYQTNLIIVPYNTATRFQFLLLPMYFHFDSLGNVTGENINLYTPYGHYLKKNERGQIESRDLEERNFRRKGLIWRYKYKYDDKERLIQEIKYDSTGSEETTTTFEYKGQKVVIRVADPRGELLTYQEMTFNEKNDLIMLLDSTQTPLRISREEPNYVTSISYYEYRAYDSLDNWTERVVLDEERKPEAIHKREITYYSNKK